MRRKRGEKPADDFESVARRLGCDENKERFEAKLGKLARAKAAATPPKKRESV